MPPSAVDWNNLFNLAAYIALAALAVVLGVMVYFTVKYRERQGQGKFVPSVGLARSRARETVMFASISIVILLILSIASYTLTPNARFLPPSSQSTEINVTAFQWAFRFEYSNGVSVTGFVNVPANSSIIFNVTSIDVMHNFYLVDYRVSIDAIPGRYNLVWINTPALNGNSELNYTIRCKELCGVGHTDMMANLTVMDPAVFDQWLESQAASNSTSSGG